MTTSEFVWILKLRPCTTHLDYHVRNFYGEKMEQGATGDFEYDHQKQIFTLGRSTTAEKKEDTNKDHTAKGEEIPDELLYELIFNYLI